MDISPTDLAERCARLRSLHRRGTPLVLPNAWDAVSARAVVEAGYPVVATSSGAVANSLGYEDHQGAPADEMLAAAARIVAAVDVPVTVDAEAGYALPPDELVARLVAIGAAGANLEDSDHATGGLQDLHAHADWLHRVREAADAAGVPLVINARIDNFVADRGGDQSTHLDDAVARASAYVAAGADCVYPILLMDAAVRDDFMAAVAGPVNLLTWPGGASVDELAAAGAARISYGGTLHRAVTQAFRDLLTTLGGS